MLDMTHEEFEKLSDRMAYLPKQKESKRGAMEQIERYCKKLTKMLDKEYPGAAHMTFIVDTAPKFRGRILFSNSEDCLAFKLKHSNTII